MELFQNFLNQDVTFYDQPRNTIGSLVSHLSNIPPTLQELLSINIALITIAIFNIIGTAILSIAVGWKLGLVVLTGVMVPMILCAYLRLRLEIRLERGIRDRFSESAGIISEAVASIRTVTSLALESTILQKYSDTLSSVEHRSIQSFVWTMLWLAISQSIIFLSMALGFWYDTGNLTLRPAHDFLLLTLGSWTGTAVGSFPQESTPQRSYIWLLSAPFYQEVPQAHCLCSSQVSRPLDD